MDNLTPAFIKILRELIFSLEGGDGLTASMSRALAASDGNDLTDIIEFWADLRQNPGSSRHISVKNPYHQILCELLARASSGQPVVNSLKHLLSEAESRARADLDRHISLLPFKALMPLLLFQFPAFLALLIGPLLRQLKNVALTAFLVGVCTPLRAETIDRQYVRKLDAARSVQDIQKVRKMYQAVQIERRACRLQLEEKLLPRSCYKALRLESRFGLETKPEARAATEARLDERCIESQRLTLRPEPGDLSDLSPRCRREVLRVRELARYRGWPGF